MVSTLDYIKVSKKEILHYQEHGYILLKGVVPERIFSKAHKIINPWVEAFIDRWVKEGLIKKRFEHLDFSHRFLEAWRAAGKPKFRRQPNTYLINPQMYKFLHDEFFLNIASKLLGTRELTVQGIFNARPQLPGASFTRAPWHQDSQYWKLDYGQGEPDDPSRVHALTMFITLQEIDTNSGCLSVISKKDIKSKVLPSVEYDFKNSGGIIGLTKKDIKRFTHHVISMKKSDILCFDHLTPHGTNPHKKNHVRWTLDIRYEPTNRSTKLGKKYGLIVQSKDPSLITPMKQWLEKRVK